MESPTLRVYAKLRQSLVEFVGVAGFQSLASRALTLATPEAPSLREARVTADGSLQGLGEIETQIDIDKDRAGEGGIILIARLLGLLRQSRSPVMAGAWSGLIRSLRPLPCQRTRAPGFSRAMSAQVSAVISET